MTACEEADLCEAFELRGASPGQQEQQEQEQEQQQQGRTESCLRCPCPGLTLRYN